MSAGELRFFVDIRRPKESIPTAGDYANQEYERHCQAWASIKYLAGRESADDRDSTLGKANIKIRYRGDITNKMIVVYDGRTFEIEDNFDPTGRRKYLMIAAKVINK